MTQSAAGGFDVLMAAIDAGAGRAAARLAGGLRRHGVAVRTGVAASGGQRLKAGLARIPRTLIISRRPGINGDIVAIMIDAGDAAQAHARKVQPELERSALRSLLHRHQFRQVAAFVKIFSGIS